jgi:hypothetical protein
MQRIYKYILPVTYYMYIYDVTFKLQFQKSRIKFVDVQEPYLKRIFICAPLCGDPSLECQNLHKRASCHLHLET